MTSGFYTGRVASDFLTPVRNFDAWASNLTSLPIESIKNMVQFISAIASKF